MLKQDELLFVVDDKNNPIKPLPRFLVHEKGYWHRTAHIWVVNKKKQILCHQRSLFKDIAPGNWDPYFGGHIGPNVSYEDGAILELKEETGIQAEKKDLQFYEVYKNKISKEFQGIFLYIWEGKSEMLSVEEDEVAQIIWMPLKKVEQFISGEIKGWSPIPYAKTILEKLST
ncbi:MAG TPA: NUDIX domain-containing protein [Methylomirabilota bacterium]|nr:NUDIX domain-containing protein [Methylomirabilota bacterium]